MTVYAQAGWQKSGRIIQGLSDGSINGVIWSPKDEFPHSMPMDTHSYKREFPNSIMLFDPQFYTTILPGTKDRCLRDYPYWRTLTRSYFDDPVNLRTSVQETLDYQLTLNVDRLISPSIEIDSFGSAGCNISLLLANESIHYYQELSNTNLALPPLLISLIVSEACLSSPTNFNYFLDDISIMPSAGFYLIVHRAESKYQAGFDSNALENLLYLVYVLAEINSYEVICGYSDFVGTLLCAVGAKAIGTGWFSNLRQFTMERFLPQPPRKHTRKRRYSSQVLINSIFLNEMETIHRRGQLNSIMSGTKYDAVFNTFANPSDAPWAMGVSTLHHWLVLQALITSVTGQTVQNNLDICMGMISNAQTIYSNLSGMMSFNVYTGDHHLQQWATAISNFRNRVNV
jgi:hypothetical protein